MHSVRPLSHPRLWLFAALAVAVTVRVALLAEKPFWRDEAWVAILVESPLAAVTTPERPRPVPMGFIAVTQVARQMPLAPEVAYRLLPLAAGIALVPLLGAFARSLGAPPPLPLLVVWLAAGLPALVYYSRELKSYGLDALYATLVPLLALHLFGRADAHRRRDAHPAGAALVAVLVAAPWLTFGSLFAIAATLAWGWLAWWRRADPGARRWWAIASATYAASLLLALRSGLAVQVASTSARQFWHFYLFADAPGSSLEHLADAAMRYASFVLTYTFPRVWAVAALLIALGLVTWPGRGRAFLVWLCCASAAGTITAALADRYMIVHGRMLLFAVPPLLLFTAAGLDALARRLWPARSAPLALGAAAAAALVWSGLALEHRVRAQNNDPAEYFRYDVLQDIPAIPDIAAGRMAAGEPLYVAQYASRPFDLYARGRFAGATICEEPCNQSGAITDWVRSITDRGWAIVVEDERRLVGQQLRDAGASWTEAATARGVALWEVRSEPPPRSAINAPAPCTASAR